MMEVAISLAIIGFALVAIIGVLPMGMNVQQQNRQETVIGEDANVLIEDIRNGALGANDLTNYVYAITNNWAIYPYPPNAGTVVFGSNTYTFSASSAITANTYPPGIAIPANAQRLTTAANIIGVLSTPEFTDLAGNPLADIYRNSYCSNHIVAYVYSISGPAVNKPPQDNTLMQQDAFGYRIYVVNAGAPINTNEILGPPGGALTPSEIQLWSSLHELRMTFLWPQLPNGKLGSGNRTFRASIAGQLVHQPQTNFASLSPVLFNTNFYVYQSQSFTNSP